MKKTFFLSFLAAAGLGTAGHFLYALWPNALTALIAPVNECVWEHLKLLFFPPLPVLPGIRLYSRLFCPYSFRK